MSAPNYALPPSRDRKTSEAQRDGREAFQCTECGAVAWLPIAGMIETNASPECCGWPRALLPSDEAFALSERRTR